MLDDIVGKGKGGGTSDSNTLRSRARVRMVDVIGEGVIGGLIDGPRSIYVGETPIQNEDGTFNYEEVTIEEHKGYPDEGPFRGHNTTGSITPVNVEVTKSGGPIQRTIADADADGIYLTVRVDALFRVNDEGLTRTRSLDYDVELRTVGGEWQTVVENRLTDEKCISPVQIPHLINLPDDGGPWDVRVVRLSDDETNDKLFSTMNFESYTVLVGGRFSYPNTAAVALEISAEEVSGTVPPISYLVEGREVEIPTNYNPDTRVYSGIWDGTFKLGITNNPTWHFRDMIVNDRFGLGEYVSESTVNKWSLYTIARYCDQEVETGYFDEQGDPIMEPRYTFDGVIRDKREAIFALQEMTQTWRGMGYWALGQVFAVADMPADPVKLVTSANVIGGEFNYSSTSSKSRHSVAIVKWRDPNDFYRLTSEVVVDDQMVQRFGWREKTVTLNGCNSRAQAHRHGRWVIDVERHETETINYVAGLDHMDASVGDIISVADPRKAQVRLGGRIKSQTATKIVIDAPFNPTDGENYEITWTGPDNTLHKRAISSFSADKRTLTVSSVPVAERAQNDAVFVIIGADAQPRQFRVLSIPEIEKNQFSITALYHDPNKYARVERGLVFDPINVTRPNRKPDAPRNLIGVETASMVNGTMVSQIDLSWTPPTTSVVRNFDIKVTTPTSGVKILNPTKTTSIEFPSSATGNYTFEVRTVDVTGFTSDPATITVNARGAGALGNPSIENLAIEGAVAGVYRTRDAVLTWENKFPATVLAGENESAANQLRHTNISVLRASDGAVLRTARVSNERFSYSVSDNIKDNAALDGSDPTRDLRFQVETIDVNGKSSGVEEISGTKGQVPALDPNVYTYGSQITTSWSIQSENGMIGAKLWISDTAGFNPDNRVPDYEGGASSHVHYEFELGTYFLRIAGYDGIDKNNLVYGEEVQIEVTKGYVELTIEEAVGEATEAKQIAQGISDDVDASTQAAISAANDARDQAVSAKDATVAKAGEAAESAGLALDRAGQAAQHLSDAAKEALDAEGYANAAGNSETIVSNAKDVMLQILDDPEFVNGAVTLASAVGNNPPPDAPAEYSFEPSTDPEVGGQDVVVAGKSLAFARRYVPIDRARRYRLTTRYKQVSIDADYGTGKKIHLAVRAFNEDFQNLSTSPDWATGFVNQHYYPATGAHDASDDWHEISGEFWGSDLRQDAVYMRVGWLNHNTGATAGSVQRISLLRLEDITESHKAEESAQASLTRSQEASSFKDAAQEGARVAAEARDLAQGAKSDALSAEQRIVQIEEDVNSAKSTAVDSSVLAVEARDQVDLSLSRSGTDTALLQPLSFSYYRDHRATGGLDPDTGVVTDGVRVVSSKSPFATRSVIPFVAGDRYRFRWLFEAAQDIAGEQYRYTFVGYDEDYNYVGFMGNPWAANITNYSVSDGVIVVDETLVLTPPAGTKFVAPMFAAVRLANNDYSGGSYKIYDISLENVEAVEKAKESASAAVSAESVAVAAQEAAGSSAGAANTSKLEAEAARDDAEAARYDVISLQGNANFEFEDAGWKMYSGNQANANSVSGIIEMSFIDGGSAGKALTVSVPASLHTDRLIPVDTTRAYRMRLRIRNLSTSAGPSKLYAGLATYNADRGFQSTPNPGTNRYGLAAPFDLPADDEWYEFEEVFTGTEADHKSFRPTTAFVTPMAFISYAQSGRTVEVDYLSFEDVTSEVAAAEARAGAELAEVNAVQAQEDAEGAFASAFNERTLAARAAVSAAAVGSGNLATNGSIADPALWTSHYGDNDSGAHVTPNEMWVADVDGNGTPGFIKSEAGNCWNYGVEPILIRKDRKYRLSIDNYRDGPVAANYFTWAQAGNNTYRHQGMPNTDDATWRTVSVEVTGDFILDVYSDPSPESGLVRMGIALNHNAAEFAGEIRARNFRVEDISESEAAKAEVAAAVTQRQLAEGHANDAGSAATAALGSELKAEVSRKGVIALQGNPDFEFGRDGWRIYDDWRGDANNVQAPDAGTLITGGETANAALRFVGEHTLHTGRDIPFDASRTLHIKARVRVNSGAGGPARIYIGLAQYDENKAYLGVSHGGLNGSMVADDDAWRVFEANFATVSNSSLTRLDPNTAFVTGYVLASFQQTTTEVDIDFLEVTDVTDLEATKELKAQAESARDVAVDAQEDADSASATAVEKASLTAKLQIAAAGKNVVIYPNATDGVGDWVNTLASTDVPPHAPAGAKSLRVRDGAREAPARNYDPQGRIFRITAWVKSVDSASTFKFLPRGGDTPADGAALAISGIIPASVQFGLDWHFTEALIEVTGTANYWAPAFDFVNGTDRGNVYDLSWEDVTESYKADQSVQAAVQQVGFAAAQVTLAGEHASAAFDEFEKAETQAGNASSAEGRAVDARNDAEGFAGTALEERNLAVQAKRDTVLIKGNLDFANDFVGWTHTPAEGVTTEPGNFFIVEGNEFSGGKAIQADVSTAAYYSTKYLQLVVGRTYRLSGRVRSLSSATTPTRFYMGYSGKDANGDYVNGNSGRVYALASNDYLNDDQWHEFSHDIVVVEATAVRSIAPLILMNYQQASDSSMQFDGFVFEDVTESEAAKSQVGAAVSQVGLAEAEVTKAGEHAQAALDDRGRAETARGFAEAARNLAVDARDDAQGYAASALLSQQVTARLRDKGISINNGFTLENVTDPLVPEGYNVGLGSNSGASWTHEPNGGKYGDAWVSTTGPNPDSYHPWMDLHSGQRGAGVIDAANTEYVMVTVEIELLSGWFGGAYLSAWWGGVSSGAQNFRFITNGGHNEFNVIQTFEAVLKRPSGFNTANAGVRALLFTCGNADGGTYYENSVRVHSFDMRAVSKGSIAGITQLAKEDLEGIKTAAVGLRAKAGSAGALFELVALDDPAGNSASFGRMVADDIILDGRTLIQSATITGANLVPDPHLRDYNLDNWRMWSNGSMVKAYTTGALGLPTKHCFRHHNTSTSDKNISCFSGAKAYTDGDADKYAMKLKPGKTYKGSVWVYSSSTASLAMRIYGRRRDDPSIYEFVTIHAGSPNHGSWQFKQYKRTIPSDWDGNCWVYLTSTDVPAGQSVFYNSPSLKEMDAADLVVDGGITANHMAVNSITAANGAIGSLAVKEINIDGFAVTRDKLEEGAASDIYDYYLSGTASSQSTATRVHFTFTIPATSVKEAFSMGISFTAIRNSGYDNNSYRFQKRIKRNGSWSSYSSMRAWTANSPGQEYMEWSGVFQQETEGVQIRLISDRGPKSSGGDVNYSIIKQIAACVRAVVK